MVETAYQGLDRDFRNGTRTEAIGLGFLPNSLQRVAARYGESCISASRTTQLQPLFSHNSFTAAKAQFLQFPESLIENKGIQEHTNNLGLR
jgi:hypothetical protein